MAASMDTSLTTNPAESSVGSEEGPASFFCRHCQSAYRQPKILRCLHSFCTQCLHDILTQAQDKKTIICPMCAYVTSLPPGGVNDLTPNSFLERVSKEYVTEVKSNLASKSLSSQENKPSPGVDDSPLPKVPGAAEMKTVLQHDPGRHEFTNLTDEEKSESSKKHSPANGKTEDGEVSDATVEEAVQNMTRLQAKLLGLQGEALRVTYAIDRVNHHRIEWLQHREDLKRAIQRRSAQFQMLVKKMERQLVSQIDNKAVEDRFYESLDKGKTELRKNLKQVLHEVSVIKGVREVGNYDEVNELSPSLLSPSVGISEIYLDKISYQFDLPKKSIEEMVSVGFGNLVMTTEERNVYTPELKDYANLKMEEISNEDDTSHSFAFSKFGILSAISGDSGSKAVGHRRSSSIVGRQSQRRSSDLGTPDILEEFQNARESLRSRRQEILRQGQTSRDFSPWRHEGRRSSRPSGRRGRVQSLDRSSAGSQKARPLLRQQSSEDDDLEVSNASSTQECTSSTTKESASPQQQQRQEDNAIPSPIIEEAGSHDYLKKGARKSKMTSTSVIGKNQDALIKSPSETEGSERSTFQEILEANRGRVSPCSSTSSSRMSVDRSPCPSPTLDILSSEIHGKNTESSRQARRAINSSADKKSKIEFLRENWQKRKEILIQNQGFVSSEDSSSTKSDSRNVSAIVSKPSVEATSKAENSAQNQIALASRGIGSPPLRSKFTSAKHSQTQQKHQETADASRPAPLTVNTETSRNVKKTVIPVSLISDEIKRFESARETVENVFREKMKSADDDQSQDTTDSKGKPVVGDGESDEEVMVVETETITIPVKDRLLQQMESDGLKVSNAKNDEKEKVVEESVKAAIPGRGQSQEIITRTLATTDLPSAILSTASSLTTTTPTSVSTTRPTPFLSSRSSSLYASPITKVTEATPASIAGSPSVTTASPITSSALQSTKFLYQRTSSLYASPDTNPGGTVSTSTAGSLTPTPTTPTSRLTSRTSTMYDSPDQSHKTSMTSYRESTTDDTSLESGRQPTFLQHGSKPSSASITTSTTPTTTAVHVLAQPSTPTTATTAAYRFTTSTLNTTSETSTQSQSAPTSSSSSSYTGRYSGRYVPRTETIDVAALLANLYKPAPSVSTPEHKGKTEDNKENVGYQRVSSVSNKPNTIDKTDTTNYTDSANNRYTETKSLSAIKGDAIQDASSSVTHKAIIKDTDQKTTGSLYQRNYYGPGSNQTTLKSYSKETTLQDVNNRQTTVPPTNTISSTDDTTKLSQRDTTSGDLKTSVSSTFQSTLQNRPTVGSIYSKYYSNPNALYSKPQDPLTKSMEERTLQTSQDQKVDETFTQAESSRRRYDPAEPHSAQSRRHTVEIGKTIPKGVKISDLYAAPQDAVSERRTPISSKTNDTIEESPAESESETVSDGLDKSRQVTLSSSSQISQKFYRGEMPIKQRILPNKGGLDFVKSERKQEQEMAVTLEQRVSSPMAQLSAASTPASSPMTEDKKLIGGTEADLDSGSTNASSSERSLKEIARKKKERWRRLTVY